MAFNIVSRKKTIENHTEHTLYDFKQGKNSQVAFIKRQGKGEKVNEMLFKAFIKLDRQAVLMV